MNIEQYFASIQQDVDKAYEVAQLARAKGLDPVSVVEIPQAKTLAERAVGLVSAIYAQLANPKIVERVLELEAQFGSLDPAVALTIAEELAQSKFCEFTSPLEAMEAGIRVGIAYLTLGVVSSPLEGFVQLKVKKTRDDKDFFAPYFSGPIRSAGGTEAAFSLVIIDHLREKFGFSPYDPTEDEVKRGVQECYEYHERITNLQYLPTEKELDFLMRHIPIQVTGDPSEDKEVYNYKDLPRIETNFIRSGFALVLGEGIAQKAPKILKRIVKLKEKGFPLTNWDWMEEFVHLQKKLKEQKVTGSASGGATYIKDLVAGRPILAHPAASGSFRLRYGRSRNTGYSTLALHPATMILTGDFIAVGTQLKIEKPTKGCTVAACDSVDGPIVKLYNGSVVAINTVEDARRFYPDVEEIVYLGDLLVPYGDYANRNHPLNKPGYVEQYWEQELRKAGGGFVGAPRVDEALRISQELSVPLYPKHIFFWSQIDKEQITALLNWMARARFEDHLILPYSKLDRQEHDVAKRTLEILGVPHLVTLEHVVFSSETSRALLANLGLSAGADFSVDCVALQSKLDSYDSILGFVNGVAGVVIRDKAGTFIGARMGRPEKAKLRLLTGSPHVLFPVGAQGGRLRSVQAAVDAQHVVSDFPLYYCEQCENDTIYPSCEKCSLKCTRRYYCKNCDLVSDKACTEHERSGPFQQRSIPVGDYFNSAKQLTGIRLEELPVAVKGVRGTSSKDHSCEHLGKGLLRAKYDLHVNKDGTIRYDMSEMPITHFKPFEIGTSVARLKELGYEKDITGAALELDDQILEMFPHDIILPACVDSPDERADDVFFNITRFVDDELKRMYSQEAFFGFKSRADLPGVLVGCIAPHNCAAVVGRIIGFSKVQALLASPYIHAAMRRDCDGDEAAVMLLVDMLVNFSRSFLPAHRGGTQDAPLVLNTHLRAGEVDDMIFDLDVSREIPLALYEAAEKEQAPGTVKMEQVKGRLGGKEEFYNLHYSYETTDINAGPRCSSYKTLPTMGDKMKHMMALCRKIRAVDARDVARLTIERHFMRDIRGNLRKFSMQVFRCVECNEKFRRVPLSGKCMKCGGKLIFTISEGSIIKYLGPALDLARTYKVSPYLLECLEITERDIQGIFGKEKERQMSLNNF